MTTLQGVVAGALLTVAYRAGKYPEEDFQVQRAQLENETALLLAEIEHLQQA